MRSVGTRDTRGASNATHTGARNCRNMPIATLVPRVSRVPTERIVYPALAIAFGGLVVILAPSLLGEGIRLSAGGVAAGLAAGIGYAVFQLVVKDLTKRVSAVTIVFTEAWLDALILLPLALWQTVGSG